MISFVVKLKQLNLYIENQFVWIDVLTISRSVNEFHEIVKDYHWSERNIKDKGVLETLCGL